MKTKINKLFIGLLVLATTVNCESYLEEEPISEVLLTELNAANIESITTAIYEPLTRSRGRIWESLYGSSIMLMNESINGRNGVWLDIAQYKLDRMPWSELIWPTLYESIGRANSLLSSLENSSLDQTLKDQAAGEATFVRALDYYTLVRFYGSVPLRLEPVENSDSTGQPLASIDEIYAQIIADLKMAESLLAPTTARPGAATSGAAKVFLADVYLTQGEYQMAASKAKEVMDNKGTYGYDLLSNFPDVFSATSDTHVEDVFSIKFSQTVGLGTFITVYWAPANSNFAPAGGIAPRGLERGGVTTASPLIAGWDDNDLRKSWTMYDELPIDGVMTNVVGSSNYQFVMGKFRDPGSVEETASGNDWPLYRYADVLLIFAEADNLANGTPSALGYDAINQVRRRAYGVDLGTPDVAVDLPAGLDSQSFDDLVFRERGYEFLGEGKRWFDLLRTERYQTFLPAAGFTVPSKTTFDLPDSELANNNQIN